MSAECFTIFTIYSVMAVVLTASFLAVADDDVRGFKAIGGSEVEGFRCDQALVYAPDCSEWHAKRLLHGHSSHGISHSISHSNSHVTSTSTTHPTVMHTTTLASRNYRIVSSGVIMYLYLPTGRTAIYTKIDTDLSLCADLAIVNNTLPDFNQTAVWVCSHDHVGFMEALFKSAGAYVLLLIVICLLSACCDAKRKPSTNVMV